MTDPAARHPRPRGARHGHVSRGRRGAAQGVPLRDRTAPGRAARLIRPMTSTECPPPPSTPSPASGTASISPRSPTARPSSTWAAARGPTPSLRAFARARAAGVIGVDMTDAQLDKATALARDGGFDRVEFQKGLYRAPAGRGRLGRRGDQQRRDQPLARQGGGLRRRGPALRPGGRLALADIVGERELPGGHHLRRGAVGRLHRRGRAARALPGGDRAGRLHDRARAPKRRLPVHLERAWLRQVRGHQRLALARGR